MPDFATQVHSIYRFSATLANIIHSGKLAEIRVEFCLIYRFVIRTDLWDSNRSTLTINSIFSSGRSTSITLFASSWN